MRNTTIEWTMAQEQNIAPMAKLSLYIGGNPSGASSMPSATVTAPSGANDPSSLTNIFTETTVNTIRPVTVTSTSTVGNTCLNEWILDGSTNALVADSSTSNYMLIDGTQAYYDGAISNLIEINFASLVTTKQAGLTVIFSSVFGEWAPSFKVTVYNGITQVATTTISNNDQIEVFVPLDMINFDKIEIATLGWSIPNQNGYNPAKIERVYLGSSIVFSNNDIINYKHASRIDMCSFKLPSTTIAVDLYNRDDRFNPSNPTGIYSILKKRQPVTVSYGFYVRNLADTETVLEEIIGSYLWVENVITPQNGISVTLQLRDCLQFMDKPFDTAHIYNDDGTIDTQSSIAYFDGNGDPILLTSSSIGGNVLEWLAKQAVYQCNMPDIVLSSMDLSQSAYTDTYSIALPKGTTYSCAEIVQLCCNAGAKILRSDWTLTTKNARLTATTPDNSYIVSKLVEYQWANYKQDTICTQVVVNDGQSSMGVYPATNADPGAGSVQYVSNPLIQSSAHAQFIAEWIYSILQKNVHLSGTYRADPCADAGDVIRIVNKYDTNLIQVETLEYTFNGMFKGSYSGRKIDG